jgi:hypothetical protein
MIYDVKRLIDGHLASPLTNSGPLAIPSNVIQSH